MDITLLLLLVIKKFYILYILVYIIILFIYSCFKFQGRDLNTTMIKLPGYEMLVNKEIVINC